MFLSAKLEYACLALLELAAQHRNSKPVRLSEITERHGIPQRFLVQILLQLNSSGLVLSTRGASGGYQLSRPPDRITLADILDAVEGTDAPKDRKIKPSVLSGMLQLVWKQIAEARQQILTQTTLEDLLNSNTGVNYVI